MSTAEQPAASAAPRGIGHWFAGLSGTLGFSTPRRFAVEIALVLAVCVIAAAWALFLFNQFEFQRLCRGFDFWFDSDPARTVANITSRWVIFHERSVLHPLYSLLIAGPFGALEDLFGLSTSTVTALYVGLQSACFAGAAYIAMRAFGLPRLDALLGVVLLYSTSAAIYWIGFPEWLAFGAATMLACVIWIAGPAATRTHATGVAQNFISGCISATTWTLGFVASLISDFPKLRWRQAFVHTRDAIALMATLTVIQYFFFPTAGGFLNIWREAGYFLMPSEQGTFLNYIVEFFAHTLAAPEARITTANPADAPSWGILLMTSQLQGALLTPLTLAMFALWLVLGGLGVRAALKGGVTRPVFVFVVGALLYYFALHAVLGGEVFLFSLHFAPLMVFIALWATRSNLKWLARGLCVALIAVSFAHNYPAFRADVATHNAFDASWLDRTGHEASAIVAQTDCR